MFVHTKHDLVDYKSFVVKMGDNLVGKAIANNNYGLLCDCDICFGIDLCVAHVGDNAKLVATCLT
jgi:hypothetical protein